MLKETRLDDNLLGRAIQAGRERKGTLLINVLQKTEKWFLFD